MSNKTIVLLGATGNLGGLITNHLLANPDVKLRALVRPGDNASKRTQLEKAGVEVREIDLVTASPKQLEDALSGAYTVVSAIQGGPEVIVEAQGRALDAARVAGVHRFIPSTFSYNVFGPKPGDNFMTDQRRQFAELAEQKRGDVEVVHLFIGCFMDKFILGFIGALDFENAKSTLWGDGNEPMDFTTYDDAAAYAAMIAVDERALPKELTFVGSTLNFHEMVATFERETGRKVTVDKRGSLADLFAETDRRVANDPADFMGYIPMMYWRVMLSGSCKLENRSHELYPSIKPTTFEQFVRQND